MKALFIGRFQPFHLGHLSVLKDIDAEPDIDEIIIGVGSSQYNNTEENPYTFDNRREMIEAGLKNKLKKPYKIIAIPDIHDDDRWVGHVKEIIGKFDVVYSGNDWVKGLFEQKGYKVRAVNFKHNISGTMIRKINQLKKEKDAIILVHNYQYPEIYEVADFLGDSLELAREAAKTDAKIIVFCGVDFMAESAKILNPDKKVLLPALDANCPMAGMVDLEGLKKIQAEHPGGKTVCYINTSAETKAHCNICCTSANAVKIVDSLNAEEIIFLPDKNLSDYVQSKLPHKKLIPWQGFCYVHAKMRAEQIIAAKKTHPDAEVIAHPECPPEVIELADHVASTSQMITCAKKSSAKEFIIATEMGMVNRLNIEVPDKKFYTIGGACLQMKKNNLERVLESLEEEQHEITVPEDIRIEAKKTLDKMLLIS